MDSSEETAVAMSKSEINRITKGLREAVKQHFSESGDAETLTVNSIRTKAEVNLSLEKDFLRTNSFWRNESKKIIREEFERQNDAVEAGGALPPPSAKKPSLSKGREAPSRKKKPSKVEQSDKDDKPKKPTRGRGKGMKSGAIKKADPPASEEKLSDVEDEPPTKKNRSSSANEDTSAISASKAHQTKTPDSELSDVEMADTGASSSRPKDVTDVIDGDGEVGKNTVEASESEMSEVLDEAPKKKRARSAKITKSKSPTKGRVTKKSKQEPPVDGDTEKIKELQGWLLKCGIRKFWGKELAKFDTAKEKIDHLKGLLANIGMTGRFSNDKARRIKEARELAEDLAAVQAGAKAWGTESEEHRKTRSSRVTEAPVKTRKLVRPELAFLDDQSESE